MRVCCKISYAEFYSDCVTIQDQFDVMKPLQCDGESNWYVPAGNELYAFDPY